MVLDHGTKYPLKKRIGAYLPLARLVTIILAAGRYEAVEKEGVQSEKFSTYKIHWNISTKIIDVMSVIDLRCCLDFVSMDH